jgi:hypothetical protein
MEKTKLNLDALAREGAIRRIEAIDAERELLVKTFGLSGGGAAKPVNGVAAPTAHGSRRRQMSVAAKRRVSAGMREYWLKRKAGTHKPAE